MTTLTEPLPDTARDVMSLFLNPPTDTLYELVDGTLVEKEMAALSIWVAWELSRLIGNYLQQKRIGWTSTELPIACFPWLGKHGRRPDVAFFTFDRWPGPGDDAITAAPNLAVEVISLHEDVVELDQKIEEYFRAGVDLVWIVNPYARTVRIQRPDNTSNILHETDALDGETVLPEFKVVVGDLFPKPQPRPARQAQA